MLFVGHILIGWDHILASESRLCEAAHVEGDV